MIIENKNIMSINEPATGYFYKYLIEHEIIKFYSKTMFLQAERLFNPNGNDEKNIEQPFFGIKFKDESIRSGVNYNKVVDESSFIESNKHYVISPLLSNTQNKLLASKIKLYDFEDNNLKIWISVNERFFHFFLDTLASILILHEVFPEAKFIIHDKSIAKENTTYYNFIKKFFMLNNIDHHYLESPGIVKINNFITFGPSAPLSDIAINKVYSFCSKDVKNNENTNYKKVYISRQKIKNQIVSFMNNDQHAEIRLTNDDLLENFLKENDFEIVYPEDFKTIEDQVSFFKNVKVLMSVTSSALVNSIFMDPGGTVIDLMTPFQLNFVDRSLGQDQKDGFVQHSFFYSQMAFAKNHTYLGVRSLGDSEYLVDILKNNKIFRSIID